MLQQVDYDCACTAALTLLCWLHVQNQLPELPTNFDTQACADVMCMDLGIPSRSASPAPEPAGATYSRIQVSQATLQPSFLSACHAEQSSVIHHGLGVESCFNPAGRGKAAKAKAKSATKAAAKQARGRRAGSKNSAAADAAEKAAAATATLAAAAEQMEMPAVMAPPAARRARSRRAGSAAPAEPAQPEQPSAQQAAAAAAAPSKAAADGARVPAAPRPLPQQRKQPAAAASKLGPAPQRHASGQAAFRPPRLAALAAERDSAIAAAAAADAEYAAAMAAAADDEAVSADDAADTTAKVAGEADAEPEEVEEWPETFTQQPRGPSLRALAAAPERTIAISTATPAGFRAAASSACPQMPAAR